MVATRRGDKGKGGDKGKKGVTTRSGGRDFVPVEVEAAGMEEEVEEVEDDAVGEFLCRTIWANFTRELLRRIPPQKERRRIQRISPANFATRN